MPKDWQKYGDHYLKLFADCVPVKGAKNSAIYDLTRHEIITFPTAYYSLLIEIEGKRIADVLESASRGQPMITELLTFLDENEFIMLVDDPAAFPAMELDWSHPGIIQNAVVDVSESLHDFQQIFEQLDALGCQHVQVRSFSNLLSVHCCDALLAAATDKAIAGVELLLRFETGASEDLYTDLMRRHPLITALTVHSAPETKMITVVSHPSRGYDSSPLVELTFTTQVIDSANRCGLISPRQFTPPSVSSFSEVIKFNGCLNRKVSIDVMGNIRNCPSMVTSFGNIKTTSLVDAVQLAGLQENWSIAKDLIEICQDCEFRYACSDCRAYVEDPYNLRSKPLKCGYDPYNGTWRNWANDPRKEEARRLYQITNSTVVSPPTNGTSPP